MVKRIKMTEYTPASEEMRRIVQAVRNINRLKRDQAKKQTRYLAFVERFSYEEVGQ